MRKSTYLTVICIYFYIFNEKSKYYNENEHQTCFIESQSETTLIYRNEDQNWRAAMAQFRTSYKKWKFCLVELFEG